MKTREEEIQIASVENANKRLTEITNLDFAISAKADYDNGLTQGFKDGAKWANKTMLEKACEYLKSLVYQEFAGGPLEQTFSDEDIEDFRKAMEE